LIFEIKKKAQESFESSPDSTENEGGTVESTPAPEPDPAEKDKPE